MKLPTHRGARLCALLLGATMALDPAAATSVAMPPQPQAIPGWYYPDEGRFVPTPRSGNAATIYSGVFGLTIKFRFGNSSPDDYPTIKCTLALSFFGINSTETGGSTASDEIDPSEESSLPLALPFTVSTTDPNPQFKITVTCVTYRNNGVGQTYVVTRSHSLYDGQAAADLTLIFR